MTREQSLKRELSQYEGLKQMYFLQIQRIHGYTKLLNDQSVLKTFLAEYTTVNEIMSEIKDVVMKINDINLQLDEAYEVNYQTISSSQQLVGHINAAYNEVKPQTSVPTTSSNMTPVLPKIVLPTFDGSKKHWPVFWETFQSLIDNNRSLDDNSKVNYLLSALRGHALEMCTGIIPTAANYQIIKDLLKERFEDKRLLMDTYLSQLLNFKQSKLESAAHLNSFLEVFDTSVTALKNLKIDDLLDYVLVFIALSKLDCETRKFFEMSLKGNTLPTYSGFISFIKGHIRTLCNSSSSDAYKVKTQTPSAKTISINPQKSAKSTHSFVAKKEDIFKCPACTQRVSHSIYRCSQFRKLSPQERYKIVMDKSLCLNCLSDKHKINVCKSENLCSVCKSKHHTMLHFDNTKSFNSKTSEDNSSIDVLNVDEKSKTNTNVTACSAVRNIVVTKTVLLSTAIVNVQDKFGNIHKLRFLLDSASQSNFITSECCQVLNLPIVKVFTSVIGIGSHTKSVRGQTNILVSSRFDPTKCYPLECLVIDKITNQLPSTNIDITSFEHLKDLCLADETFHVPSTIHGIIGASMFAQLLGTAKVIGPSLSPIAVHTPLGYVVMGEVPTCSDTTTTQNFYAITTPVESLVKRFWELEEVPESSSPNPEDMECEKIFTSTITRESSGRYTVCLPFKENPQRLGDSYNMARKRFFNLEKRFQTEPSLKETYSSVIHDYIQQNHMTLVPLNDVTSPNYFIPHHCVRKVDSLTTPLRVVFDSSAKSSTSVSLNELLHTGPKLQSDLQQILLNFRLYSIAMTADIKQMYRQINICKEHRKFQLILWRDSPELPLSVYSLNTVSFGVKPSPYLAIKTVQQLAKDEAANYPLASAVATRDFYVDDLVCSVADIKSAVTLHKQMVELFLAGGFPLVKWCSNSPELLHHIPENLRSSQSITFDTESLKILGLNWNPRADMFSFNTDISTGKCSKRNILSAVARMFDPLGFVSPVVLFAKNLIKELWKRKLNWDDEAPLPIQNSWKKFIDELNLLEQFNVPRHLQINLKSQIVLIGFADASETAYGACIYFRTINDEKVNISLVCSKSKVSPLKTVSIPRLELCAALLLAKLISFVVKTYNDRHSISKIFAFSDSTVVLNWIHSSPHLRKTFVANRVSKIQSYLDSKFWYHIPGVENPADCISRGLLPAAFINHKSWLTGPSWLINPIETWPLEFIPDIEEYTDENSISLHVSRNLPTGINELILRHSSWSRLLHSMIYILRFLKLIPRRNEFTIEDLEAAESYLIQVIQNKHFSNEIKAIENGDNCSKSLITLRPFLNNKILRVGGRLTNASIGFDAQHPILLPKRDHFTNLLIDYTHEQNLHTGPNLLLSILRQKYWILSARQIVRQRVHSCNRCFKLKPKPVFPLMADLPAPRVTQSKSFEHSGVDFAGPFTITLSRHRGVRSQKAYLCLFVCLTTKALHLELASDLSTDTFIAALKRFLARRGTISVLYSDRGTNFVGAHSYLKEVYKLIESSDYNDALKRELLKRKIKWQFNPARSPHFGGIWESAVKCVKQHLYRVIGTQVLTYEELATVLTQIEALLNSRPLYVLSSDPTDPTALTPAHFLNQAPLSSIPSTMVTDEPINLVHRKHLLDAIVRSYWKRWHREYLSGLQIRQKWNSFVNPVKIGNVVIILEDNTPPLHWPLGVIEEVFEGTDGIVRVAKVRTKLGVYTRPVVRLCPLPTQ